MSAGPAAEVDTSGIDKAHSAKIAFPARSMNHARSACVGSAEPFHFTPRNGDKVAVPTWLAFTRKESQSSKLDFGDSDCLSATILRMLPLTTPLGKRVVPLIVSSTSLSRAAIVLPPLVTEVPAPERTTRFSM